jgi:hypothetical protein
MSKHVGRKQRWNRADAKTYSSDWGKVLYERGAWYAVFEYRTLAAQANEGGLPTWLPHSRRLGPFKRPRNAMVALERELTSLKNHFGTAILVDKQIWAES